MNRPDGEWTEYEVPRAEPRGFFREAKPKGDAAPAHRVKALELELLERVRTLEARVAELEKRL
jgi:hypothetical protein